VASLTRGAIGVRNSRTAERPVLSFTLMKQWGGVSNVPVSTAAKGLPVLAILASTGTNAAVMGDVAKQSRLYAQTLFLAEKYDLPLPADLAKLADPDDEPDGGAVPTRGPPPGPPPRKVVTDAGEEADGGPAWSARPVIVAMSHRTPQRDILKALEIEAPPRIYQLKLPVEA
jgi:hypothetical protein